MAPLAPSFAPTMPTTFRVQTLPEILTSHRDTRMSSSLGHAVSSDGPSGTVGGLTSHAGDVSHGSGMGSLELREPAHHTSPPAPAAPTLQLRRLADPAPISTSSPSLSGGVTTARLPEPTVSRSLLDTAPLAARPTWERPLPVARVVDAPAAAAASSSASATSTAEAPIASSPAEPAPLVGDDPRVGGFGVDLDGELAIDATPIDDAPRSSAPPELAPPIQPRRLQRRVDGGPAAPVTRPSSPTAPLLGDAAPSTSVDRVVPDAPDTLAAAGAGATAAADLPLANRTPATPPSPSASRRRIRRIERADRRRSHRGSLEHEHQLVRAVERRELVEPLERVAFVGFVELIELGGSLWPADRIDVVRRRARDGEQ